MWYRIPLGTPTGTASTHHDSEMYNLYIRVICWFPQKGVSSDYISLEGSITRSLVLHASYDLGLKEGEPAIS